MITSIDVDYPNIHAITTYKAGGTITFDDKAMRTIKEVSYDPYKRCIELEFTDDTYSSVYVALDATVWVNGKEGE